MTVKDFEELIFRQVESDTLDYKAHQSWNTMNTTAKGKIVRHLTAFANTVGGCLVVGVGEDASGCPCKYTGLTKEESRSFDPTAVGTYVNQCVEPPIDFSIERPMVRGKRYAVFIIRPFTTLPHVCTRTIENELQSGVFYIRTREASSRPAYHALEMHRLINRALRNQREALAKMLRDILYDSEKNDKTNKDSCWGISSAEDVFSSETAYFRRRRSPRPGEPEVLVQYSVSFPADLEFNLLELKDAALAALGKGRFISANELKQCVESNTSLRYLSPSSPRMFQLYRQGWISQVEFLPAPNGELSVSKMAETVVALCLFVRGYYKKLGLEDVLLELKMSMSGLSGSTIRLGSSVHAAQNAQIMCSISRTSQDIGRDVAGYAARLLRSFGECFGLPDSVLEREGERLLPLLWESAK